MEENKLLKLKHKEICGKNYYYPDNEASRIILSITKSSSGNRKALTEEDLEKLKSLGFEMQILRPRVVYE